MNDYLWTSNKRFGSGPELQKAWGLMGVADAHIEAKRTELENWKDRPQLATLISELKIFLLTNGGVTISAHCRHNNDYLFNITIMHIEFCVLLSSLLRLGLAVAVSYVLVNQHTAMKSEG